MDAKPARRGITKELRAIARRSRQVWRLVPRRYKAALGGAVLIIALVSGCNTAIPLLLGALVNKVVEGAESGATRPALFRIGMLYLGIIGVMYVLREGLNVLRRYLVENTCTRVERTLTIKLVTHLMKVDLSSFTHEKIGALHGRIQRSIVGSVRFLRLSFLDFFPAVLSGAFALLAALTKQPWLALVMAGVIPVSLFLTVRQLISQKGVRLSLIHSREVMDGTVVELLSGLDYVRVANTHHREIERVGKTAERLRAKEVRHHFQMSLFGCAKALNEAFFNILVLAVASYLAMHEVIKPGDILTFSVLFLNVMAPLNEIHRVIDEGHESSLQVGILLEMLAEPTDRSFHPAVVQDPVLLPGKPVLEARDLCVEYLTADGKTRRALDGITLAIRHGEKIGVAGRSGCGKSTWLRVMMRLTHPSGGTAALAGVPLDNVSRETIGELIGYVGQSPFVFAGTIADNIAYGSEGATPDAIERAARMAALHDEIMAMPAGYHALVAERGQNLSGGQRQRIALARAFLKNPPVLILDEGTSALDNISEHAVQRALAETRSDRTVVMVAHRLSTLVDTDRIFVFDNGRIVETGTFGELVLRGGVFTELINHAGNGQAANGDGVARRAVVGVS